MSVLDTLVTDRSNDDLIRWSYLKTAVEEKTATETEKAEWLAAQKGAYNYTDWNRVGEACTYLYEMFTEFGYAVDGYVALRTDFTMSDLPTVTYWNQYLATIAALKAVWSATQEIPASMDGLTVEKANQIERLFLEIDDIRDRIERSFIYSAEAYAGEF